MKLNTLGLILFVIYLLQGCNTVDTNEPSEEEIIEAYYAQNPNALRTGDRIETTARATIYNPLTVVAGTQPSGAAGLITNGPKIKGNEVWYRVNFDAGVDGLVSNALIQSETGIDDVPEPNGSFTIGWLGCSMTRDLGKGMASSPAHTSWENKGQRGGKVLQSYSGGVISSWGQPGAGGYSIKWSAFDRGLADWPDTDLIVWQMCINKDDITQSPEARLDQLAHISKRIAEKAPGIPLYIINQPTYQGVECSITGPNGVAYSQSLVDLAVERNLAREADGLQLGPLLQNDVKDGCHVNKGGQDKLVAQMVDWLETL